MLERVMVDEDGEIGGPVGGGRLGADNVSAADEATGRRQCNDDDDRVEHQRQFVALNHRACGRHQTADAHPPFGVAAGAKPHSRVQLDGFCPLRQSHDRR